MKQTKRKCRLLKGALLLVAVNLAPLTSHLSPCNAQTVTSPCPEVLINEKYDHVPLSQYQEQGWDTAVTCATPTIELSSEPYVPVQYFNGTYVVEEIPFNPPDPSFYMNYNPATDANNPNKKKLAISSDDAWAPSYIDIAFPFYFFGLRKTKFLLGDNGIVTFATPTGYSGGQGCPFATTTPLPWATSVPTSTSASGSLPSPDLMRDAIYGVYEDTYTGSGGSYMSGNQGIYYGVLDAYPCRKIIATWNEIPLFINGQSTTKRQSYQMVCYEGSNIIEVHVKKRYCCSSTNSGSGTIGIQNATGQNQVRNDEPGTSNHYIVTNPPSPAAFWANGWNPRPNSQGDVDSIAFRFTPQGTTLKECKWYRLFPNDSSVVLGLDQNDTNGYVSQQMTETSTLTKAVVAPHCVSRYICELRFKNADTTWYNLRDTITIGVDTTNEMTLQADGQTYENYQIDVCQGHTTNITLSYPRGQAAGEVIWSAIRKMDTIQQTLPTSMYNVGFGQLSCSLRPDDHFDTLPRNKIDTIIVRCAVTFVSGCVNHKDFMVRVFPNFDTVVPDGICTGETYTWQPCDSITRTFTQNTDPEQVFVNLQSRPGCDSTVHLALTVFDVSLTYHDTSDCKPITWRNGVTYTETNSATSAIDTVILKNLYDCDSVVQLRFTLVPVTARIKSSLSKFDFDHLDTELTDLSTGNDSRVWHFPNGADQTGVTAHYSIPVTSDEAEIFLTAISPYGCADTTSIIIPFNKECFWVPNAFTPDDPTGNNIFASVSIKTTYQEMFIYNRLGELVFQCEGADCGWDGKHMNGTPCPQGAYVYVIRYSNAFEPKIINVKRGTVTLIR